MANARWDYITENNNQSHRIIVVYIPD